LVSPWVDKFDAAAFEILRVSGNNWGTCGTGDGSNLAISLSNLAICCAGLGGDSRVSLCCRAVERKSASGEILFDHHIDG